MNPLRPKHITFDCHGTLIHFEMNEAARALYGSQLSPDEMVRFCKVFSACRLDEAMDILHVSSSFRYDLMSAHDMGVKNKVFVNRGHEPAHPYYENIEIRDISGLAAVVGL